VHACVCVKGEGEKWNVEVVLLWYSGTLSLLNV